MGPGAESGDNAGIYVSRLKEELAMKNKHNEKLLEAAKACGALVTGHVGDEPKSIGAKVDHAMTAITDIRLIWQTAEGSEHFRQGLDLTIPPEAVDWSIVGQNGGAVRTIATGGTKIKFSNRISSPNRGSHCEIERQVLVPLVEDILAAGYAIAVWDGDNFAIKASRDEETIFAAMASTDEDRLYLYEPGKDGARLGWIYLVYGNSGWDVVSDYTTNIPESVFARSNAVAERFGGS